MRPIMAVSVVVFGCFLLIRSIYAVNCPKGTFISKSAESGCQRCPNGTFSDSINSTKCRKCEECHGKHNQVTEACTLTSNAKCTCAPGSYSYKRVVFCMKCNTCKKGWGVKNNCSSNRNTVCEVCVKGSFYSDTKDLSACKPCTKCQKNDIVKEECTRRSDTVCIKENDLNLSKRFRGKNMPPLWPTMSSFIKVTIKMWRPTSKRNSTEATNRQVNYALSEIAGDTKVYIIILGVLGSVSFVLLVAFSVVVCYCNKRRSKNLPKPANGLVTTATTVIAAQENPYTSLPLIGTRQGNIEKLGACTSCYPKQKCVVAPDPLVLGQTLTGAGGGRFLVLLTKKPNIADKVKAVIQKKKSSDEFAFYDVSVDKDGLTVRVETPSQ